MSGRLPRAFACPSSPSHNYRWNGRCHGLHGTPFPGRLSAQRSLLPMQDKPSAIRPLTFGALAVNVLLLLFLAWHLAFEAVPEAVSDFASSRTFEGRLSATIVLLPYAWVLFYLASRPRQCIFKWKTAAAVVASMAGYIARSLAVGFYMMSLSLPPTPRRDSRGLH